jgi:hypothetical protein
MLVRRLFLVDVDREDDVMWNRDVFVNIRVSGA